MSPTALCAVILLVCGLTFSAAQTSCKGRCGAEYDRGSVCQCDYSCLSYGECCKDFESQCTTKTSCKGRCGENFKRGRRCSCDSECIKYNQCCSDHKLHCDEEISGAASVTAPVKTNSCHNVNDNKPKEPTQNEATEEASTFGEGNNADDHLIPLVSPTSYPQDDPDLSDVEDQQATPIPESTSGSGLSTADLLDQDSTEPTPDPDTLEFTPETFTVLSQTQATLSDDELTQADDNPSTLDPTIEEAPTESTDVSDPTGSPDAGTALPQAGSSPAANTPEPEATGQEEAQLEDDVFPEAQNTDPTAASIVPSEASTIPAASTLDPTSIPEATTSNPEPDDTQNDTEDVTTGPPSPLADLEDPSVSVSPAGPGSLSELDAPTASTDAVPGDPTDDVTPGGTTADPLNVTPDPTKPAPSETTSKPQKKPETKPLDAAQTLNIEDPRDYQADDSNDTNLCSGRPVGAVTTLRNGTVVVFRGHYFWFLDRNRVPGPARGITQVWHVPSPIDTAFTRCNCQGKTYIFKGPQYWRFENDALDPGYPKVIATGFDGLRGHITAALSVPQYQRRRESVYFFKRGGSVQKYSYQFGTSRTCGEKPHTAHNRIVRQAVSLLGPSVSIRTSWKGFPSAITAAASIPSSREPEGYKYYVFSRSKSYNVRMDSDRPVIAAPAANTSPQSNNLIKCPKKV